MSPAPGSPRAPATGSPGGPAATSGGGPLVRALAAFTLAAALGAGAAIAASRPAAGSTVVLEPAAGASLSRPAEARLLPRDAGGSLVERRCLVCHALPLIQQQRLSADAWKAEVVKMRGWGAFVDDAEAATIGAYLASNLGREAAPYLPATVDAREVEAATLPEPAAGVAGDPGRGALIYKDNCAVCHGAAGEGGRGPALRRRPIEDQPGRFASAVRDGRGDMPGYASSLGDADLADLLAFVRGEGTTRDERPR